LNEAGILLELEDVAKKSNRFPKQFTEDNLKSISMEELKIMDEAVKEEDYDTALKFRKKSRRKRKLTKRDILY
jgi:hypothetical protein